MEQEDHNEEIVYEEDQGAQLVKKLRARLKKCEQEKKEYLDGWQRLKADTLNANKQQSQALSTAKNRAVLDIVHDLLPALDSFDIAVKGAAWEKVDSEWRVGIEHVRSQILSSLENHGVESYGTVGDDFDPQLHEAISHKKGSQKSNTVAEVTRQGYKMGDIIIRAAQVVVYK